MLNNWGHSHFRPDDEAGRLAALERYEILDSGPEGPFDDLVSLARALAGTTMAHISLIDEKRQWFKAKEGIDAEETERDIAFCDYAIRQDEVTVILDATQDPRFADSPLVTGPPYVRFYAGAPIITPDGYAVGTVCVVDHEPRSHFDKSQALAALARQALALLELRKTLHRNEEAAEIAADQRDRLWDSSLDMMLIMRGNGDLVAGNPAWERSFGPVLDTDTQAETTRLDGLKNISDYLVNKELSAFSDLNDDDTTLTVERELKAISGEKVYTSWTLARQDDMIFGIARDLTPVREAEAKLAHVQRMESIGQLTGGIAHDFNNLLTIILGNLDMASRRIERGETDGFDKIEQSISNAKDGAKRAANLTQRLLAFARRQPLSPTQVNPETLLKGLEPLARQALDERYALNLNCGAGAWPIEIDGAQLENAIINLVVNARDAMNKAGSVCLSLKNHTLNANEASSLDEDAIAGDYVEISVEDNGTGISKEIADKIFEPFFTTKDQDKGTGLGLSQVQGFVVQSGGFVTIESKMGVGTCVSIWLPRAEAKTVEHEKTPAATQPKETAPHAGSLILLVEDNDELRGHVADLLSDEGLVVKEARNGQEAVDLLADTQSETPCLMLSDIMMPKLDGHSLAKHVRAEFPSMPIMLMTGYAGGDMPADSPHDALIMKPFSPDELIEQVHHQLARIAS